MKEVDNAIAIVKEAKAETEKALEVGIKYSPINGRCDLFIYSQSVECSCLPLSGPHLT